MKEFFILITYFCLLEILYDSCHLKHKATLTHDPDRILRDTPAPSSPPLGSPGDSLLMSN